MNFAVAQALLDYVYPFLAAFGLAVARALGMVIISPTFNRLGLTGMIRSAVAVVLAIPVAPVIYAGLSLADAPTGFAIAGLLIKEMAIGLVIGLAFGIPFWAAEVAGELVDLQRGSTMAQLVDPLGAGETSISSTLLTVTLITLFFMSGGFTLMVDGYYRSYGLWPTLTFSPIVVENTALEIVRILDRVMQIGVLLIAPIVVALLVADMMLAYLSRMAPQLHVFDLSLPVKNLLFSFLMVLYASFLVPLMLSELGSLYEVFDWLEQAVSEG